MSNMLCTIPFPTESLYDALRLSAKMNLDGILVETRADWVQIVQASPMDFDTNKWYVVVHTGNLLGMIHDLKQHNYL